MANTLTFQGITWDHSRAFPPLVATAQRYEQIHPHIRIQWQKRTLHEFGHANLGDLAERFDLIVMDHPWVGYALTHECLTPLQDLIPAPFREELEANSVGQSYDSYMMNGQLLALPIDAAAPTASYRPDLLERHGHALPETWEEVLALADQGLVLMPTFHVDLLLNLYALCVTLDPPGAANDQVFVSKDGGLAALDMLRALTQRLPHQLADHNPVAVYEAMAREDQWAYCPFAYSYSNYSRPGYCQKPIFFADVVRLRSCGRIRTVLGGAGLAVSRRCQAQEAAIDYACFTATGLIQRTLYNEAGGQPAHRTAWTDGRANHITSNFFKDTEQTMNNACVRPRYDGFVRFQETAGIALKRYLFGKGEPEDVLEQINQLYRQSRGSLSEHM